MSKKKTKVTESVWASLARYMRAGLDIIITFYMILVIVFMPFYYQEGYNHIGSDKSYFFRTYTSNVFKVFLPVFILYLIFLIADWFNENKWENKREKLRQTVKAMRWSITDLFAAGYAVAVVISYFCSEYPETALWGTVGWYMGMIPQLMLVGIYFAVSRLWKIKEWVMYLILPISAAEFLLGYLNRFGVWPLKMESSGRPDFISTIGNINWFCGYMMCTMLLGMGLFWLDDGKKKWKTALLALYCFISLGTLIIEGSESGLFAIAIIFMVLFISASLKLKEHPERMERFWQLVFLLLASCIMGFCVRKMFPGRTEGWWNFTSKITDIATDTILPFVLIVLVAGVIWLTYLQRKNEKLNAVMIKLYRIAAIAICVIVPAALIALIAMITVNTLHPGSLGPLSDNALFTFTGTWGSNRGETWRAAIVSFLDQNPLHKLVGVGPDCMADYIYQGGNWELAERVATTFEGNRLTNAHCEWLTILVCSGLLGFVCYAGMIISFIKRIAKLDGKIPAAVACGLCVLAYTCNNVWSFQQSMSVATIFIVFGIGANYLTKNPN